MRAKTNISSLPSLYSPKSLSSFTTDSKSAILIQFKVWSRDNQTKAFILLISFLGYTESYG